MKKVMKVHPNDNVIVALETIEEGEVVRIGNEDFKISERIPAKHKFSACDLNLNDRILMYGVEVGRTLKKIANGALITTENIKHSANSYHLGKRSSEWETPDNSAFQNRKFEGYHRRNGQVGAMNFWIVIPLVFCENRNIEVIKEAMVSHLGYSELKDFSVNTDLLIEKYKAGIDARDILKADIVVDSMEMQKNRVFPNIDGIKFLTHERGCGETRQDSTVLCNLLASYICHSNVAGATVLSLGCQNAQIEFLQKAIQKIDPNFQKPVFYLEQQASKSERSFIAEAVKKTFVGLMEANNIRRKPAPLSKLIVGLECGGSDGFSGLTANPALGHASDILVSLGGSAILSEFPELHGVEQELINRCVSDEIAVKFMNIMHAYAKAAETSGSGFHMNPSPGNIRDGLITDAIKSAGAARKGGSSPVTEVLDYAEVSTKTGLNLLCTPGSDVESTTGLAGAGANIIVFTTGLGTPTGNPIVPVIKFSTNSQLAKKMKDIIDIDAGDIIDGNATIKSKGEELLELIIETASGRYIPRAMSLGQDDFIPWKRGVSL